MKKETKTERRNRLNRLLYWANPLTFKAKRKLTGIKEKGMTPEAYESMLASQNGVCAICKQSESTRDRNGQLKWRLSIDHNRSCCPNDKSCGRCIRGLLCQRCNTGIGMLGDEIARLKDAIAYLEKGVA